MVAQAPRTANPIYRNFSRNMRFLRNLKSMTQRDLAERLGVDRLTVIRYEQGKFLPDFAFACRLADILGCSVADLRRDLARAGR